MDDSISKIDTQGMSGGRTLTPEEIAKSPQKEHKPAIVNPRRIITPELTKELKIFINEVLDEREYKRRLGAPYDDVKPLPVSYFDTEHFKYYVGEEEPPYEDWSQ